MTPISKTILFFGTEAHSLITLQALVEAGFPVGAVITKPDSRSGRGQRISEPPVKTYALSHGITVLQPERLIDIMPDIKEFSQPVGVLVAYGKIIPQSIIDLFTPGIINLHPSLLPRYRGPSPIEAAIANRDQETGVSIMQLSRDMDAGPVYAQQSHPLTGEETRPQLYDTLFRTGSDMLMSILPDIISGNLQPTPQDESAATYCSLLSKKDSVLDPSFLTAADAEARVRAHLGFPRSRVRVGSHELIVTKAHVAPAANTPLDQAYCDGNFLVIDELIAPSGKTMSATQFLRGNTI